MPDAEKDARPWIYDKCSRRAETGCTGFSGPHDLYVCDTPCRQTLDERGEVVPLWPRKEEWKP